MIEKLLQAAAITLLLSMLAGVGVPKPIETPHPLFQALSLPMLNLKLNLS